MFFNPLSFLFMIFFFMGLIFLFFLVQVQVIVLAFVRLGIPSDHVFTALFLCLVGSFVNIPVKRIPQQELWTERLVSFFGFRYVVPVWRKRETVLAVNLGGAVIPVLISLYLLFKTQVWPEALIATAAMAAISYKMARPIRGVGIAMPAFVPPVLAACISLILNLNYAPVIAYISGTVGTLIGADLLNIKKIGHLGAPVASIGGAGTFDGIFLNGILAVLLAAMVA